MEEADRNVEELSNLSIKDEQNLERYRGYVGQRWTGVCRWFNVAKGYGFLIPDHEECKFHNDDVFVHQSELQMQGFRSVNEGELVEFTVRLGKSGALEAEKVTGVKGEEIHGHSIHPLGRKKQNLIRCYNCGKLGTHKATKCKNPPSTSGGEKLCYNCSEKGHLIAECPHSKVGRGHTNEEMDSR